jgi:chromosome segregation ATPase
VLLTYTSSKITDAARRQLEQIAGVKRQIAESQTRRQQAEARINEIGRDQERIRQNIDSLNRVSGQQQQVQTYARQLAAQESEIASLRDQSAAEQKRIATLQAEVNRLIENLTF